jgi:hypothetical protein
MSRPPNKFDVLCTLALGVLITIVASTLRSCTGNVPHGPEPAPTQEVK